MAGGIFEKALATYEALFGTDDLRAALEDEQAEVTLLLQQLSEARAENASLQRRLALAYRMLDESPVGDAVRASGDVYDVWQEAAKDMVQ